MSAKRYTLKLTAIELDALCRLISFVEMIDVLNSPRESMIWQLGGFYNRIVWPGRSRPRPWYRPAAAMGRVLRQVETATDKLYDEGKMLRGYE